jgi:hypothetical protein
MPSARERTATAAKRGDLAKERTAYRISPGRSILVSELLWEKDAWSAGLFQKKIAPR